MSNTHRLPLGSVWAPFSRAVQGFVLIALPLSVSCAGSTGGSEDAIDQEVFIATYVDLRITALDTDSQRLAEPDREEILTRHGVTELDLEYFVTANTNDVAFMRDVWNEVEKRMDKPPS
jgi:hypothetical protein